LHRRSQQDSLFAFRQNPSLEIISVPKLFSFQYFLFFEGAVIPCKVLKLAEVEVFVFNLTAPQQIGILQNPLHIRINQSSNRRDNGEADSLKRKPLAPVDLAPVLSGMDPAAPYACVPWKVVGESCNGILDGLLVSFFWPRNDLVG